MRVSGESGLRDVARWIYSSSRVVALTGAGVSTSSGLPDYRGPNGVWATGKIPHINDVEGTDEERIGWWQDRKQNYPFMASRQPTIAHEVISKWAVAGYVLAVITQNIDGLHQKSGVDPERVLELHGSSHVLRCQQCGAEYAGADIQARLLAGEVDPRCTVCGGPLRSGTVLFGESLNERTLMLAQRVAVHADPMIVIGTSLIVNPAAQLPQVTRQSGGRVVIVNREPTPLDDIADVILRGDADDVLADLDRRVGNLVAGEGNHS